MDVFSLAIGENFLYDVKNSHIKDVTKLIPKKAIYINSSFEDVAVED